MLQLNWKQYLLVSFSGEAIHWSDLLKPWVLSSQRHYRVHYPLTLSPSLHTLGYQAPCAFSPVTSMAVKWFYHTTSPIDIIALIAHSQITSNTEGVHNMFYISLLPTLYIFGPFECDNFFWKSILDSVWSVSLPDNCIVVPLLTLIALPGIDSLMIINLIRPEIRYKMIIAQWRKVSLESSSTAIVSLQWLSISWPRYFHWKAETHSTKMTCLTQTKRE